MSVRARSAPSRSSCCRTKSMRFPEKTKLVTRRLLVLVAAPLQPLFPPEQRPHTCEQDREIERLGQIVVGASLKTTRHVISFFAGREDHHGDERPRFTESAHDLETIETGQHHIEKHKMKLVRTFLQPFESRPSVVLYINRVAFCLQVELQPSRKMFFVLDDQYMRHDRFKGSSRVNVLPFPAPSLTAYARPPWRRATALTIESPKPVPLTRVLRSPRIL